MATHSSILAWEIPWTEEPGRLQSVESQRVGHDWATELNWTELSIHIEDPVLCAKSLPGESFSFIRSCEVVRSALFSSLFAEEMELQRGEVTHLRSQSMVLDRDTRAWLGPETICLVGRCLWEESWDKEESGEGRRPGEPQAEHWDLHCSGQETDCPQVNGPTERPLFKA